jgi:DNA replication protein DnaC
MAPHHRSSAGERPPHGAGGTRKENSRRSIALRQLWHRQGRRATRRGSLRLQRQLASYKLLIVDELSYVPLSQTGAELLFEVFSQHYERGSTIVTSNLPFEEWTSVFGAERLTGALLDRLTHHVHILEMDGESHRLTHSKRRSRRHRPDAAREASASD